jgi:hypothetical protein
MRIAIICSAIAIALTVSPVRAANPIASDAPPTPQVTSAEKSMAKADDRGGLKMLLTPGAKIPEIGPDASALEYVRQAKSSLELGRTGEAELALEWAQARSRVDEEKLALSVHESPPPYDSACKRTLCQAMLSLGHNDKAAASTLIDTTIDEMLKGSEQASR